MIYVMIVKWQSDIENTKESVLTACDKPYHTNKKLTEMGGYLSLAELGIYWCKWKIHCFM